MMMWFVLTRAGIWLHRDHTRQGGDSSAHSIAQMATRCYLYTDCVQFIALLALLCLSSQGTAFRLSRDVFQPTSTQSPSEKKRLPISTWIKEEYCRDVKIYSSKGFGKVDGNGGGNQLARTTPQQHKEVTGSYSKLLAKQAKKFEDMKKAGGQTNNDIYARLKGSEICWFIGKCIHAPSISDEESLENLSPLLVEYAKSLRPLELARQNAMNCIEIWIAPGNSEMDVAQNKIGLRKFTLPEDIDTIGFYPKDSVGYEPEIYLNNEEGFRARRDPITGEPVKAAFEVSTTSPTAFDPNHPDYDPNVSVKTAGGKEVVIDAITKATGYRPPTNME